MHPLAEGVRLVCRVTAGAAGALTADEDAVWARLCDDNPRLHDGAILAVRAMDLHAGTIEVAADSFKRLVTCADGSVRLLGVKAVITGVDASGGEHVLVGRRHPQTRAYGGMWELAPSGGVGPGALARESPGVMRAADLLRHLAHEAEEELGIDLFGATDADERCAAALLVDAEARSVDVVFRMRWRAVINPHAAACRAAERDWEYIDTAWLAQADARAWVHAHTGAVSPATVKLLGWMGWV